MKIKTAILLVSVILMCSCSRQDDTTLQSNVISQNDIVQEHTLPAGLSFAERNYANSYKQYLKKHSDDWYGDWQYYLKKHYYSNNKYGIPLDDIDSSEEIYEADPGIVDLNMFYVY